MSFILDALKKLEREKENKDPDLVMVGPVPWGGRDRGHLGRSVALAAAAVAVLTAGALWWASRGHPAAPEAAEEVRSSTPAPTPSTTPSPEALPASPKAASDTASLEPPPRRALSLPGAEGAAPPSGGEEPERSTSAETPAKPEEALAAKAATDEGAVEFRLTAISSRDGEPVALLNDRLVREGDAFDDVRILRIGAAEVEIEVGGERRTIGF